MAEQLALLVRARLLEQGWSLAKWARDRGYPYRTTVFALTRHTSGLAGPPRTEQTKRILADLTRDTGIEIVSPRLPHPGHSPGAQGSGE